MNQLNILDGAIGTELIARGETLPPHIWSAEINQSNPQLLLNIHEEYIKAGANHIIANTFRTTARAYQKTGLANIEAQKASKASMKSAITMAKKAACSYQNIKVLGSIAPLEDCYSPELFPGFQIAKKEYYTIANQLKEGGIDGYIIETMNNILEIQACLEIVQDLNLPIWISLNLFDGYHIKSQETLESTIDMISDFNVDYILLNCNPLERTNQGMKILSKKISRWGIYPNLGIGEPSPNGIIKDYCSDEEFLSLCKNAIDLGASIIGGCCGTRPMHIKLLKDNFKFS